ncbi:MAG: hypothetical protein Q8S33_19045 [Myxococcales bacterium]|nr:hypothetical protein [Myxococcales bacterium]
MRGRVYWHLVFRWVFGMARVPLLLCLVVASSCVERGTGTLGDRCSLFVDAEGRTRSDSCEPPLRCLAARNSDGVGKGFCVRPCVAGCTAPCVCNGEFCRAPQTDVPACAGITSCAEVPDGCGGTVECNPCSREQGEYCGGLQETQCGACKALCPELSRGSCQAICAGWVSRCGFPDAEYGVCLTRCPRIVALPNGPQVLDCLKKTCSTCSLGVADAGASDAGGP